MFAGSKFFCNFTPEKILTNLKHINMIKYIKTLFPFFGFLLVLSSCNPSPEARELDELSKKVDDRGSKMTEDNWQKAFSNFVEILDRFAEDKSKHDSIFQYDNMFFDAYIKWGKVLKDNRSDEADKVARSMSDEKKEAIRNGKQKLHELYDDWYQQRVADLYAVKQLIEEVQNTTDNR